MNLYPDNIEQKIDFTIVRQWLREACSSSLGREQVDAMTFLTDFNSIKRLVAEAAELQRALNDTSLSFPDGEFYDVREQLRRIRIEGLYIEEADLFSLLKCLKLVANLQSYFRSLDSALYPHLHDIGESKTTDFSHITRRIDLLLDRYGHLRDNASAELARIRAELSRAQGAVSRTIDNILRRAQADGIVDKDAAPALREGRLVLPVSPAYKRKLVGIVHDESASGKTVYIEPQEVVDANNHIRELEGQERRERIRILVEISLFLRPSLPDLMESQQFLASIDFLRAKARVGISLQSIEPVMSNRPWLNLVEARHPILYHRLPEQGKAVVPLNIRLGDKYRILVISGPNAGGKSVCLKTTALLQYMLQCGLTIPVNEASEMGIFNRLMIDIGDEQSIDDDLSTYSSHLRNMKSFLRWADSRTLFLIDEFGTGTEPLIGGAIAESVLLELNAAKAIGVITTHYTNLKHIAEQTEGIINGAMLYDRGALRPLFQLSVGQAGSSFAIEIAKQIGLPPSIISHATELIGSEHIDYDRQLQDIARDKRYWANKRDAIRMKEKELEKKIADYDAQLSGIKAQKREIINEAKKQATDILEQSNATIERTIREIKEAKAEKQLTRLARAKVEEQKRKVKVDDKADSLKIQQHNKNTGDSGQFILHDLSDLKRLTKSAAITSQPVKTTNIANTMRTRKLSFNRTLDMRGMRVDEALEAIIAYIDDAIMVGADEVIILHGTGTGAVKQVVRDYLDKKRRDLQRRGTGTLRFHDGDPDHGGAGQTIVEL